MARWAAFVGLTGVATTLLLALAYASQKALDAQTGSADGDLAAVSQFDRGQGRQPDRRLPRFEPPEVYERRRERRPDEPTAIADRELSDLSSGALLANVALTQGLFGALVGGGALFFQIPLAALGIDGSPLSSGLLGVLVGLGLGLALWIANEGIGRVADAAGVGYDESMRELLAPDDRVGWVVLLAAVLPTVALVEEFIFRAALIGAVAAGFGASPWALALVSSVAFGVAHGAQGRIGMLVTGSLGMALAGGFVLTGSLLVVVVAHYLVNAVELVVHEGLDEPPAVLAD